jgi:hypothetical protein
MAVVLKLSFSFLFDSRNKCTTEDRIMKFCVSIDINIPINYRDIICKSAVTNVSVRTFVL